MVQRKNSIPPTENMKQILKIETFYVKPPVNTDEILNDLDWSRQIKCTCKGRFDTLECHQIIFPTFANNFMSSTRRIKSTNSGLHRTNVATTQKLMTIVVLIFLLCGIWMPVLLAILSVSQT